VAQLEDDDVLHAEVALDKVHALGPCAVGEAVGFVVMEPLLHEALEVLEQVDLGRQVVRKAAKRVVASDEDRALLLAKGRDVVKVPDGGRTRPSVV